MKRTLTFALAVIMVAALSLPILAAENDFVPSITEKAAPEIVTVKDPSNNDALGVIVNKNSEVTDYIFTADLVVTPVSAVDTSSEIPEEARQELKKVYEALSAGTMTLPYEKVGADIEPEEMVIRDLFSAVWINGQKEEQVNAEGVCTQITFNLNVKATDEVYCFTYHNNVWEPVEKLTNNGDGTVTCLFEQKCPVAFAVRAKTTPAQTGDAASKDLYLWVGLMVASAAALTAVVVAGKARKTR